MKIKKETNFNKIEQFLQQNFSAPTHWPDWNIVVSKHFNTNFYYFAAYKKNALIGICPVHETQNGRLKKLYSGQFHYIPNGGWIFSEKASIKKPQFPLTWNESLTYFSLPEISEFKVNHKNANNIKKTLILNLTKDLDTIWKEDIHSKRRNMIRKAKKNEIKIQELDLKEDIDSFYEVYQKACYKNNLNVLPRQFFLDLNDSAININFSILSAYKENNQLSNVAIAYDKSYSFYWLGNNNTHIPNLGQNELLQWEAIKKIKTTGCKYYDLCFIEKERLPHIYKFKKGFAKQEQNISLIVEKSSPYKLINKIEQWF
jgi:hypothetical protein